MKLVKNTIAALVIIIFLGGLAVAGTVYRQKQVQRNAEMFLADLKGLSGKTVTYQDIMRLTQKYHAALYNPESPCSVQACLYSFVFTNGPLAYLFAARHIGFSTALATGKSLEGTAGLSVVSIFGSLVSDLPHGPPDCVLFVRENARDPAPASGVTVSQDLGGGKPWKMSITLWPEASRPVREQAYSFNLDCLSKIGGCRTLRELMKSAWPPPDIAGK